MTRRQFLGQASCAGVGATALFSSLLSLRLANSLAAQTAPPDYRALVCLFLSGGNDSFNMLVPTTTEEYAAYAAARGGLALARNSLLAIAPANLGGRTFGIHPSMPEVRDLFNAGNLAFVANVGSLIRPTTLADYKAGRHHPVSLYSHADQIKQWQTCIPDQRTAIGWGGRAADVIRSLNQPGIVSMNISLAGLSIFLTGRDVFGYSVSANGADGLSGYNPLAAAGSLTGIRSATVDSLVEAEYRRLFEASFGGTTRDAIDAYYEFTAALSGTTLTTPLPAGNSLAANLAMVARTAASAGRLGARRQVFFVQLGGWDHHDEVLNNQTNMLRLVSQAVDTFWKALQEVGLQNQVTLFTASDFGRTLKSNGNGSDHGWGGNHFAMGGAVAGGKICGNPDQGFYPFLQSRAQIDTGQGRLIPGVAVDEYARDLLLWFGVSPGDLDYVLPAFSSRFAGRLELGLMGQGTPTQAAAPVVSAPAAVTPAPKGGGSAGGGAVSPFSLGAAGALVALRALRNRRLAKRP
ncbi:MAG: DUF1501 domain-containing protein [Cephaloticoccus sp.]